MPEHRRKASWGLAPALLVSSNLLVFTTFSVYHGNQGEFDLGYLDLFLVFAPLAVALAALLIAPVLILSARACQVYVAAVFGLGILLWVQGSFLTRDYGLFDGRGIDWESFGWLAHVDVLIWLAGLLAAIAFARYLIAIASHASWVLITLQSVLVLLLSTSAADPVWRRAAPPLQIPVELLDYSSAKNIVHIVLDSFQSDVFQELVEEQQLQDELEGFVLFRENVAVAPYTSFSIPAIFSGGVFDGIGLPAAYYREAIESGFQSRLFEAGYTVNLVPTESMRAGRFSHYYDIPSLYQASPEDLRTANAARLFDVALFRQSPHFLRRRIYNENRWVMAPAFSGPGNVVTYQEKLFFRDYVKNIRLGDSKPAYHFLHLLPPHPPYVTLADGSPAGEVLATTRENYKNEARAVLRLFIDLLRRLRELGLYDSSLIVLQGDHGSEFGFLVDERLVETCLPRMAALLTVKLPGSSGPLAVSPTPTSLLDVAPTVLKSVGLDRETVGKSVFEIDANVPRARPFFLFEKGVSGPEISRYSISGLVSEGAECLLEDSVQPGRAGATVPYGATFVCGLMGNADPYLGQGWAAPMSRGCWNNRDFAELVLPVAPSPTELLLNVRMLPHIQPGILPKQTIVVSANGKKIQEWTATEKRFSSFDAVVPRELLSSPELQIRFDLPDATSPRSLAGGGDRRPLAMMLTSFRLDVLPRYEYGTVLELGSESHGVPLLGDGWTKPTRTIRWTDGYSADLYFSLPEAAVELLLEASFIPFIKPEVPRQRIRVIANGQQVATWTANEQKRHTFQAPISKGLLDSPFLKLTFELPDAASPSVIGSGRDTRTLGIAVRSLRLSLMENH